MPNFASDNYSFAKTKGNKNKQCTHSTPLNIDGASTLQPCLDNISPSSVSNLREDYHNPLPAKLAHTRKINLRQLVSCWKTCW